MLTVYSKNNCPFCVQAKKLLEQKGIAFTEVKIDEDESARDFVVGQGHRTVPQIYKNGELFVEGGFQGLSKLSTDELHQRLESTNLGTL
jgi:glutaredoxin 3